MRDVLSAYAEEVTGQSLRKIVVRCTVEDCPRGTKHGKPWCSQHVPTHSPYARQLAAAAERMDRAKALGSYTPEMLEDARRALAEFGELTVRRLARELNVGWATAVRLAERLARDLGVEVKQNRRGKLKIGAA